MEEQYPTVIGEVVEAHYYETMKAIRAVVKVPLPNHLIRIEIPITTFSFRPGMDKDKEMRKTAQLLVGKPIKVMSVPEE